MQKTKKWRFLALSTIATSFFAIQTAEAATYTVQKGDSLTKIAQNNQVTVADIKKWNNLSNDIIYIAQKLEISKQSTNTVTKVSSPTTTVKPTTSTYTVQKGDTLSKIAQNHQVTVEDIIKWNNLSKDTIYVTQKLEISKQYTSTVTKTSSPPPTVKPTTSTYTVQKGDTLSKIAQNHQVTVEDIIKWNNLSKDTIFVTQKLVISKQSTNTVTPTNPATTVKLSTSYYTVAKGDTLSKIAKQYNVTLNEIKDWNGLKTDNLNIGQVLKVSPVAAIPEGEKIHNNQTSNAGTPSKVTTNNPTANGQAVYTKIVDIANALVGTPYIYGGNTSEGLDCSGLIYFTFNQGGLKIGRDSSEGYFNGNTTEVKNPIAGDLVFFENTYKDGISHMGIYIGNNKFVHAGIDSVEISDVTYSYWSTRLVAYKRFDSVK